MNLDPLQITLTIITIVAAAISVFNSIQKFPNELRTGNVDLAEKYRKFAEEESSKRLLMENQVIELKNQIQIYKEEFKKEVEKKEKEFNEKLNQTQIDSTKKFQEQEVKFKISADKSAKFENWARRLCAQAISLGYIPVPLDPESVPPMEIK